MKIVIQHFLPDRGVVGRSFGMPWANSPPGGIIGKGPLGLAVSTLLLAAAFDDERPKINMKFSYKLNMHNS